MATNYNPKIATDGLVLCLDAANSKSYPGTGTTWTDVSGNGNNFTMVGSLSYSTLGFFTSTASTANYWKRDNFSYPTSAATLELWVRCNLGSSLDGLWSYASTAGDNNNLLFDQSNLSIFGPTGSVASGISINNGLWCQVVRVSNRTSGAEKLFVNGVEVFATTLNAGTNFTSGGTIMLGQEQDSVGGGLDSNQALEGSYSNFKIYNRILTDIEVAQNFNASRGRFGI
jgi:hypothetical protein